MSKSWLMNRRYILGLGITGFVSTVALQNNRSTYLNPQFQALDDTTRDFTVVGRASLRERASAKGLIYGAAARQHVLSADQELAASFAQECGILVPEWELKWNILRPNKDSFNFTPSDWLFEFARTHNMLFRGHPLVWHEAMPKWFEQTINNQNAREVLLKHISTVVGHYAGKVHSWDVVNEAIDLKDGRTDGLRNTRWLQLLGLDYIDFAFQTASEADPQALLVYNDYGLDYDSRDDEAKRVAVLKLLERLKSRGTPVQALGLQAHLHGNTTPFNPKKLKDFLSNITDLGLKVLITEMDVKDTRLPQDSILRERIVAGVYEDYLSAVLENPAVTTVLTWGLSDRYTWLSEDKLPEDDQQLVKPLLLDIQMKRKLAWNAVARTFDKAARRSGGSKF
jgi:endo-1,4-beta-xylanase